MKLLRRRRIFLSLLLLVLLPISAHGGNSWYEALKGCFIQVEKLIGQYNVFSPERLYILGDVLATSRDEELHYIKLNVELRYFGYNIPLLHSLQNEMKDAVESILLKMTIQRAKEDFIDHFLHKDIEMKINSILDSVSSGTLRIIKVYIPEFLIN